MTIASMILGNLETDTKTSIVDAINETNDKAKQAAEDVVTTAEDFNLHMSDGTKHVTSAEKNSWNSKANAEHTHTITNITGLQTALDGKAANAHTHVVSNVTGLQEALDGKISTSEKGVANGVASLDANGKIPSAQITAHSIGWDEIRDFTSTSESSMISLTAGSGYKEHKVIILAKTVSAGGPFSVYVRINGIASGYCQTTVNTNQPSTSQLDSFSFYSTAAGKNQTSIIAPLVIKFDSSATNLGPSGHVIMESFSLNKSVSPPNIEIKSGVLIGMGNTVSVSSFEVYSDASIDVGTRIIILGRK